MHKTDWHGRVLTGAFHPKLPDLSERQHPASTKGPQGTPNISLQGSTSLHLPTVFVFYFLFPWVSVLVHVQVCACVCMSKPENNLDCQRQEHHLPPLRQGPLMTCYSQIKLDWLIAETQGSSCLCLPGSQITSMDHHI